MAERREPTTLRITPSARAKIEERFAHKHRVTLAVALRAMLAVASRHGDEVDALLGREDRL